MPCPIACAAQAAKVNRGAVLLLTFRTKGSLALVAVFPKRPAHYFVSGAGRASRFSRVEVPCMPGASTSQVQWMLAIAHPPVLPFRLSAGVGIPVDDISRLNCPAYMSSL